MHFRELETYKIKYPTLSKPLNLLDDYLYNLITKSCDRDISPPLVAKQLGIQDSLAFTLLMLAHEANIITPIYYIYCPTNEDYLGSYTSQRELPKTIYCPYENKNHSINEYFTELTFRFSRQNANKSEYSLV